MLVSMGELLQAAEKNNYAVGGFNCPTLENVYGVIQAAEAGGRPVILSFPHVHEKTVPLSVIAPILLHAAKEASVPVCVHLDHGGSLDYIEQALKLGFNSVMYDGSRLGLEENIKATRKVVEMAAAYGADVEAELGGISGDEAGVSLGDNPKVRLTDIQEAERFARETGITSLAASIGTAHGFYTEAPQIDFERIDAIHRLTGLPLVMHGGSGISAEDYHRAIGLGIRKINYYSYMARAGVEGVKSLLAQKEVRYFHELSAAAKEAMAADVEKALAVFANRREFL